MITSICWILLFGMLSGCLLERLKLPRLVGMMLAGMMIGPFGFNLLDGQFLSFSADIRKIALVIILIRAGLKLSLSDLRQVGCPALLLGFLPAVFEIVTVSLTAPLLFPISPTEAFVMGSVLGAVSPAVIVPKMIQLLDQHYGTQKGIPQMILASSTFDDIVVIVLFTTFLNMAQGQSVHWLDVIHAPLSIGSGIIVGIFIGFALGKGLNGVSHSLVKSSLMVLMSALSLLMLEQPLSSVLPFSGLIAILTLGMTLRQHHASLATSLSDSFNRLWEVAEIFLFVLLGSAISLHHVSHHLFASMALIGLALVWRIIGVFVSLIGTDFTWRERFFCAIAFIPKATVQAAIGGIPLATGLTSGQQILTLAVLAILITAPLGATLIDYFYPKCLAHDTPYVTHDNISSNKLDGV